MGIVTEETGWKLLGMSLTLEVIERKTAINGFGVITEPNSLSGFEGLELMLDVGISLTKKKNKLPYTFY